MRKRADVVSRVAAADAWDAGIHAECELGTIGLGLAVEPNALGILIEAPYLGQLRVGLDVEPDGTTRISRVSRKMADGRDAPVRSEQDLAVQRLEAHVATLEQVSATLTNRIGVVSTERDEARDRASIMSELRKTDAARAQRDLENLAADRDASLNEMVRSVAEAQKANEALLKQINALHESRQAWEESQAHRQPAASESSHSVRDAVGLIPLAAESDEVVTPSRPTVGQEARELAERLQAENERLMSERDEARAIARKLHQKNPASRTDLELSDLRAALSQQEQLSTDLVQERDELNIRLEALGRMLEQERAGRVVALAERDEWHSRFRVLARGAVESGVESDISREETRSYLPRRDILSTKEPTTDPEALTTEPITDPLLRKLE